MFQVASHPTNFPVHHAVWQHDDLSPVTSPTRSSFSSADVQLPRTLQRPSYSEVSRDQIAAVAPELVDVPAEYIRRSICAKTNQYVFVQIRSQKLSKINLAFRMLAGISALSKSHLPVTIPKSHLRHNTPLTVPIRTSPSQPTPSYPTHFLALSTNTKSQTSSSDQLPLVPTHSLVLAAHCAALPRMPASTPQPQGSTVTIPVLPLAVPSPQAFQTLHQFLYTHNVATLLHSLLPSLPSTFLATLSSSTIHATLASGPKLHQLSSHCLSNAQHGQPTQILMGHAHHITALWRNVIALGVHDKDLWDAIDLAWEIILGSLNLAAGVH